MWTSPVLLLHLDVGYNLLEDPVTDKPYKVELEGYNDGKPYMVSEHQSLKEAQEALRLHRSDFQRVRLRLIHVLKDFS